MKNIFFSLAIILSSVSALVTVNLSFDSVFTIQKLAFPKGLAESALTKAGLDINNLIASSTLANFDLVTKVQTAAYGSLATACESVT